MKKEESSNAYTIEINNKLYRFTCNDGEQHVQEMEKRLTNVLRVLDKSGGAGNLSDYAVKVALFLADELAHEVLARKKDQQEMENRLQPLLKELGKISN